jgi:methylenetetrahydrofolate reductase (NADPH)
VTRIVDLLGASPCHSVELWPPRSPAAEARLSASLDHLDLLRPSFASITYGAAGSTRDRTHEMVVSLQNERATTTMAHLACAAHRRDELVEILERYRRAGIDNVLALRGDAPEGSAGPVPEGELVHAVELVELAKSVGPFCVAVAAHPAGHPEAASLREDRRRLAEKLRVADFAITQFFFHVDEHMRLLGDLEALGVTKPVIPGIMPITSARTLERMAALSGVAVPAAVADRVAAAAPEDVHRIGVDIATELCAELLAAGVPGLHFYTMNHFSATLEVCAALGLVPATDARTA